MKNLKVKNTILVALVAISAGFFVACGGAKVEKKEFFVNDEKSAKEFGDYIIANQNKPIAFSVGYCINPDEKQSGLALFKIIDTPNAGLYRTTINPAGIDSIILNYTEVGEIDNYALMEFFPSSKVAFADKNTPDKFIPNYILDIDEINNHKSFEIMFAASAYNGGYFTTIGFLDNNLSKDFKGIHLQTSPKFIKEMGMPNMRIMMDTEVLITGDKAKMGFFEQNTMNDFVEKSSGLYDKLTKCPDFKPEYGDRTIKPMAYLTGYFEVGKKDEENKITLQSLSEEEYKAKLKGQK